MEYNLHCRTLKWADIKESKYLKLKNDPLKIRPGYIYDPSNPPAIERALKYENEEDDWANKRFESLTSVSQLKEAHTGGRSIYLFEKPFVVIRRHLTPISEFGDKYEEWDKEYYDQHPRIYRLERHSYQHVKEFLLVDHWIETYLVDAWYDEVTPACSYASWVIDNDGHEIYVHKNDILMVNSPT